MNDPRTNPPYIAEERTMLEAWLDFHRETLQMKCDGLTAEGLRERAVPPSTLSLLGLVRHMAEVERSWFQRTLAGADAPPIYYTEEDRDGDFDHVEDADPEEAFATWQAQIEHSREIAAGVTSLDAIGARERHGEKVSLRWIYIHMIEEYARHNGHADFLRERIDGTVGD